MTAPHWTDPHLFFATDNDRYRDGWDRIFGSKKEEKRPEPGSDKQVYRKFCHCSCHYAACDDPECHC